jgi:regulator of sirC expression with transglutaminase-like and TPR domain
MRVFARLSGWLGLLIATLASSNAQAESLSSEVRRILSSPDAQLNYARAVMTFDRLIDPALDEVAIGRELDSLAAEARALAGPAASDEAKLNAVRRVIYRAGPWNGQRPFSYDHSDPLGLDVRNKLLSTYLRTRLGNCVSMPVLFLVLADRLGLNVSLASAPLHLFIRYTDPAGRAFNLETTSGANLTRPEWYRQNLPMTEQAIESGLYMRTLSKREVVAHMATTVMDWSLSLGRYQEAVEIADVILEHFPRDGYTMVKRGHAYGELLRAECVERFPVRSAMPIPVQLRCDSLAGHNMRSFQQAEALGWRPAE